jgi:hypothetical protein
VIFVDGPKGEADTSDVLRVSQFARNSGYPNVRAIVSDKNKGLRKSIFAGVTSMCAEYGRVIVLEDDLVVSPALLRYFGQALDRYEKETRIYSVSAHIYDCPELRKLKRGLILPITNSWGWATWQRAWTGFDPDMPIDEKNLKSATFRKFFNVDGFYPLSELLELSLEKSIDSWLIHWYYHIFINGGLTVYPPQRYVENHGMRQGATHGSALNPFHLLVRRRPEILDADIELPEPSQIDYWAMDLLKRCRETTVHRWISHAGRLKRRILSKPH